MPELLGLLLLHEYATTSVHEYVTKSVHTCVTKSVPKYVRTSAHAWN